MGEIMNLAVVGVPKSGTSMLCNALTHPGETVVLYEPWATFDSHHVKGQAASLGYHGDDILGWAQSHRRWGVKEVKVENIRPTLARDPEILVLLVRNLRHAALSMRETHQRLGTDLDLRRSWIEASAALVLELYRSWPRERLVLCHYERFVQEPAYREAFRRRIDWPALDGDVDRGLGTWLQRPHEAARHGGAITGRSLARREAESDPQALAFAEQVVQACGPFNQVFGYDGTSRTSPTDFDRR